MKKTIFLLIVILFISCNKEITVDLAPEIEFISIEPLNAQEYSDEITITIKYVDQDGDLGDNNPEIYNLFVLDNRNDIEYKFRIPRLSPNGSQISIEGNFNIKINGSGITNGLTSQQVNYDIYIVDRAGHVSNLITTSDITIYQ